MSKENSLRLLSILFAGFILVNCGGKSTRVDPTVVSTSYDYTKPVDIAAQSKPVWILPVINKGWIPARVDPKTGDWVSGHYQATVVQDGYWATQEEAELSGRPYIIAGESSPVVPTPVQSGPTQTTGGGAELDLVAMQNRISEIEQRQNMAPQAGNPEQLAALSAQMQAMSQQVPAQHQVAVPAGQNTHGYMPDMTVEGYPQAGSTMPYLNTPQAAGTPMFSPNHAPTIVLPPMPAGTIYEIPSNPHMPGKMTVHYLENNRVEIDYMGQRSQMQINPQNRHLQMNIPTTVNLDR